MNQALHSLAWREAMLNEYNAFVANNTWDLVPASSEQNVVGCKWVFHIKCRPDGTVERYKARLVAKGFHQWPSIDYFDTFSLVVKPAMIRTVLSLVLMKNWSLRQMDVNNAFLHGTLSEQVFMSQPPDFINAAYPSYVCKLRKAIYGLKQAPRAWFNELCNFLAHYGFYYSRSNSSLFVFARGSTLLYLLVYVDDLLLTGNDNDLLNHFVQSLSNRFSMKNLGQLKHFLGIEVLSTPRVFFNPKPISYGSFSKH